MRERAFKTLGPLGSPWQKATWPEFSSPFLTQGSVCFQRKLLVSEQSSHAWVTEVLSVHLVPAWGPPPKRVALYKSSVLNHWGGTWKWESHQISARSLLSQTLPLVLILLKLRDHSTGLTLSLIFQDSSLAFIRFPPTFPSTFLAASFQSFLYVALNYQVLCCHSTLP